MAMIPAQLADLRDIPLDDLSDEVIAEVIHHIMPDTPQVGDVPVAAFQSAI